MTALIDDTASKADPSEPDTMDEAPPRSPSPIVPLIAGVVLLIGGLIAAGYGLFQLVVTDVVAMRAQERLSSTLEERFAVDTVPIEREAYVEAVTATTAAPSDDPVVTAPSGSFDSADDIPTMPVFGDPSGLDPLVPLATLPWVYEAPPGQGEPLGRIVIPQADVDWVIVEGVTPNDLRQGPGHMPNTAVPGQIGNAVISGHRTTYGAPFFNLDRLVAGDRFTVETVIGTHTYEVVETRIVAPTDVWVTGQWEGSWLTLTTCNPRYSARERLIVFSRLVDGPNTESLEAQFTGSYVVPEPTEG